MSNLASLKAGTIDRTRMTFRLTVRLRLISRLLVFPTSFVHLKQKLTCFVKERLPLVVRSAYHGIILFESEK